jgi:hypothetical protein
MKKLTYKEHMDLGVKLDDCRKTVFEVYKYVCDKHGMSTVPAKKLEAACDRIRDARTALWDVAMNDYDHVPGCDAFHSHLGIKNRETP